MTQGSGVGLHDEGEQQEAWREEGRHATALCLCWKRADGARMICSQTWPGLEPRWAAGLTLMQRGLGYVTFPFSLVRTGKSSMSIG